MLSLLTEDGTTGMQKVEAAQMALLASMYAVLLFAPIIYILDSCTVVSVQAYLLADKWWSRFLCVGLAHAAVHVFIMPVGKRYRNWQLAHSAMEGVVLSLIQTTVLNYLDLWWSATAIFTEIVSIMSVWFPMKMFVTWLLTHPHQLGSSGKIKWFGQLTMVDWHISINIQYVSIGAMHTICKSMAWGNFLCLFNSETTMSA